MSRSDRLGGRSTTLIYDIPPEKWTQANQDYMEAWKETVQRRAHEYEVEEHGHTFREEKEQITDWPSETDPDSPLADYFILIWKFRKQEFWTWYTGCISDKQT